jgi:ABC-2 type transport system ATP-binding protein
METAIEVDALRMTYRAPIRGSGWKATLGSVVNRQYRDVAAVQDVSFALRPGEIVGFIGPNGAGKTTTMKILSGLLHATSGRVQVLGHSPWQRRSDFLRRIALIRGSQPVGGSQELTVLDTLQYQQLLYEVPPADYRRNLDELTELLELTDLLHRQLRALSLGEKMRAGLALSLLYRPEVMFLDEPTLGLDVTGATTMRRFVSSYAEQTGATVLLTSHYMADVASLCPRLVLIDKGKIQYDGLLGELAAKLSPYKLVRLTAPDADEELLRSAGELVEASNGTFVLRVPRERVARITAQLLTDLEVVDLAVEEAPLEVVIDRAYREGVG